MICGWRCTPPAELYSTGPATKYDSTRRLNARPTVSEKKNGGAALVAGTIVSVCAKAFRPRGSRGYFKNRGSRGKRPADQNRRRAGRLHAKLRIQRTLGRDRSKTCARFTPRRFRSRAVMLPAPAAASRYVRRFRLKESGQEQRKAQNRQQQRCESALHFITIKAQLAAAVKLLHNDFGDRLVLVFVRDPHGDGRFALAAIDRNAIIVFLRIGQARGGLHHHPVAAVDRILGFPEHR